ncbi:MAG: hypothetical protein ABJL99_03675 [Aliishimia sp.]
MKPMLAAFAVLALITVVAGFGLPEIGFSAQEQGSGDAVRLN